MRDISASLSRQDSASKPKQMQVYIRPALSSVDGPVADASEDVPTGHYNGGYGGVKPKSSLCSHAHTHVHPRRGTWLRLCDGDSECERRVTLACRVPIMALIRGGPEGLADAHQHTRGGGDHASSRSANQTEENKGRGECGR